MRLRVTIVLLVGGGGEKGGVIKTFSDIFENLSHHELAELPLG